MKRRALVRAALVISAAVTLGACGKDAPKSSERSLTQQEASSLAQATYLNYQKVGAVFQVNTVTAPGESQLQMLGMIDWKKHTGMARVATGVPNATLTGITWMTNAIAERRPSFDAQLQKFGKTAPYFIVRKPNMNRRVDQVASILMGLAAEQPENAQLILQKAGSAFLREDSLRQTDVIVLRYGARNIFWLDKKTGEMMRFEGSNAAGTQQIVVDFMSHGAQKVGFPAQEYWVDAEKNSTVMEMTSGF